jgi:predicted enzyme related to lactoylglutathione lyase
MYVHAEDVDATVKRATELGATVVFDPFDVPEAGRMGALADPQGRNLWHETR